MKKFMVWALALALLVPVTANAAAQFSLGGFIKLNTFWDSSQNNSNMSNPVQRDNNVQGTHGRFNMKAQESRFNFTIKGPKMFGAIVTGFIEMDFDGTQDNANVSSSGTWLARLRHAMFRLNWPDTELLLGQYHSLMATWSVDAAESSAFQMAGTATQRLPQIRLTQKFLHGWSVAGLVGLPASSALTNSNPYLAGTGSNGADAETPQLQGSIRYTHDYWGKAAYFGRPRAFTAQLTAGWQRSINRYATNFTLLQFGQNNYTTVRGNTVEQQLVNPWIVMGTLYIPVIPTHSANLAGTASLMTQWFVGQGVEAFGIAGMSSNLYQYQSTDAGGVNHYDVSLMKRFGGVISANYYFTNEWYMNVAYGISKCYGVNTSNNNPLARDALSSDQFKAIQQVDATLWFQPVKALKFGLQYTYAQTKWFQKQPGDAGAGVGVGTSPTDTSNTGNENRVMCVGFFFF